MMCTWMDTNTKCKRLLTNQILSPCIMHIISIFKNEYNNKISQKSTNKNSKKFILLLQPLSNVFFLL